MSKLTKILLNVMVIIMVLSMAAGCTGGSNDSSKDEVSSVASTISSENSSTVSSEESKGDPNAPKSLKVLSNGHSYSRNSMMYLWDIAHDAGVEEIELGIVYIAGCPIDKHWDNIENDADAYVYFKNTNGTWNSFNDTSIATAIADNDWDIVTLQQGPSESGRKDTFGNLNNLISYVKNKLPNARLFWHLTWANQGDYYSKAYETYFDCDQMKMYNGIIDTYISEVMPIKDFEATIPSGTVIQNLRTSFLGDTLTRDGYHLNESYGCYAAGLTWYATLCKGDVDAIKWYPEEYPELNTDAKLIRQAVKDAMAEPLTITQQAASR